MNTTESGRSAEARVVKYLKKNGWKVLDQNWRNRWCEIDVIARDRTRVYFVEVKFRTREEWGDGFDAITSQKVARMSRAAEAWVQQNDWDGEYELLAARVTGEEVEFREIY